MDSNKEEKWYKFWEENGFFRANPKSPSPPYGLLVPPPNLTGDLHLGHAMQHSILDAIARFKRMQGFDVLLLPGVDHAGIQFEGTFDKCLAKEGLSKQKLGRDEWLKKAWQFKEEVYNSVSSTWRFMGLSADWEREVFTLEEKVQKATFEEFKTFWEQDLLYKGAYIVQWCPKCGSAIEDIEMEYEERKEKLYFVRYKVSGVGGYITVATARPETIPADVAIAIYPNHPEFSKFYGKQAENPITHNEIPIIQDERVDKNFGTGALKITPGHDLLDYAIGKENNLRILQVIGKDGRIVEDTQIIGGLKVDEARAKIVTYLAEKGHILVEETKDYIHSVPVCERCKTTVEPLISEEWFIKMKPLAQRGLKKIKKVNFVPKTFLKIISLWIKEIHDWSISRSLWWGHRIPVWYCQKCNPNHLVGKDKDMMVSMDEPGKTCQSCSQKHWIQDEQVLDTWFSSGLWPLSTLGWPSDTKEVKKYYPWSFEISAPEIKFLWIARMIMLGLWFADDIPFKNMFFHGMLRDLQGRKFSKSLGNGIDPNELRNQWGTDATRMALYTYSIPGRDGRASKQTMDERAKNFRNFGTKLINIARFIVDLAPQDARHLDNNSSIENKMNHPDDQAILGKLKKTIKQVTSNLDSFQLHLATDSLYEFIWHQFADKYIESTKNRRAEAQPVLEYVFKTSLELLHPFMPFITEELWQRLPHTGKSIMLANWPSAT
ncbi:valine--tRNA ligase [Candidatus Daviesbacteria bacterium]|nr:valine--tRNA ligase [Candidatus Daviesbacteria bacterium]